VKNISARNAAARQFCLKKRNVYLTEMANFTARIYPINFIKSERYLHRRLATATNTLSIRASIKSHETARALYAPLVIYLLHDITNKNGTECVTVNSKSAEKIRERERERERPSLVLAIFSIYFLSFLSFSFCFFK